jgi:hypothetical protein
MREASGGEEMKKGTEKRMERARVGGAEVIGSVEFSSAAGGS